MDRHFGNVVSLRFVHTQLLPTVSCIFVHFNGCNLSFLQCELDIMFHLEKAHFMLEEMVMNGCIVETSKTNILAPIQLMDKAS